MRPMLPQDVSPSISAVQSLLEGPDDGQPALAALIESLDPAEVRQAWLRSDPVARGRFIDLVREYSRTRIQRFGSYTADLLSQQIQMFGWSIGEKTYGRPLILEPSLGRLTIGRYCSLADPSIILGNHTVRTPSTYPFMTLWFDWPGTAVGGIDHVARDVVIGNDVWIGHQAIILPGARIGDGCVIGAGTIVSGTIPPYSICVGNPGRVRSTRFAPEVVEFLLKVRWWDWPDALVDRFIPLLIGADMHPFIEAVLKDAEVLGLYGLAPEPS
jgi:acetyltransferase-like isoleucine patch superfamily enzyme